MGKLSNQFRGSWRITEMELWDEDYLDMEVPAYLRIDGEGMGEFQFGLVQGWIDCRYCMRDGLPCVEFSWEGRDEGDDVLGRAWAVLEAPGKMRGRIFIHRGDDSEFMAERG